MLNRTLLSALVFSSTPLLVFAQDYQTFLYANYVDQSINTKLDGNLSTNQNSALTLGASYYFSPRPTLGPLSEFDFINQQSFVSMRYQHSKYRRNGSSNGSVNDWFVGGEYLYKDWVFSSDIRKGEFSDRTSVGIGYFINKNLKVSVFNSVFDGPEEIFNLDRSWFFRFKLDYVIPLKGKDYFGISYSGNERFEHHQLTTKYFSHIGGSRYISLTADAEFEGDDGFVDDLVLGANFHFNQFTLVGATLKAIGDIDGFGDVDSYSFDITHFVNHHASIALSYTTSNSSFPKKYIDFEQDTKLWELGLTYQF